MSKVVFDLVARQHQTGAEPLQHPAGVLLPFDGSSDAELIIPEIRSEIRSGSYSAETIALLPAATKPGDRVLVVGAGLGVVSTLVARDPAVDRVIAVEANTLLIPYLHRVHALNGVTEVETLNAILASGKRGRAPFFARQDLRSSSLLPHDRSWQQVVMVPFMDLKLVLSEEEISLIILDIPVHSSRLIIEAGLGAVDRILINCETNEAACTEGGELSGLLSARGFHPIEESSAAVSRQTESAHAAPRRTARLFLRQPAAN